MKNITSIKQIESLIEKGDGRALINAGFFSVEFTKTEVHCLGHAKNFPSICLDPEAKFEHDFISNEETFSSCLINGGRIVLVTHEKAENITLQEALTKEAA